jgi:uncharacterized membrane protein YkoI
MVAGAGWVYADNDGDEAEVEVAGADLPSAVVDAVHDKFPEAKILEAEKEVEDGQTLYEVEIDDNGDELEVEVTADGKILEVESDNDDASDG